MAKVNHGKENRKCNTWAGQAGFHLEIRQLTRTDGKYYRFREDQKPDQCIHKRAKCHYCLKIGHLTRCYRNRWRKESDRQSPTGRRPVQSDTNRGVADTHIT